MSASNEKPHCTTTSAEGSRHRVIGSNSRLRTTQGAVSVARSMFFRVIVQLRQERCGVQEEGTGDFLIPPFRMNKLSSC